MPQQENQYEDVANRVDSTQRAEQTQEDWVLVSGNIYDSLVRSHRMVVESSLGSYEQRREENIGGLNLYSNVGTQYGPPPQDLDVAQAESATINDNNEFTPKNNRLENSPNSQGSGVPAVFDLREEVIETILQQSGSDLTFDQVLVLIIGTEYVGEDKKEQIGKSLREYVNDGTHLTPPELDNDSDIPMLEERETINWNEIQETSAAFVTEYKSLFNRFSGREYERKSKHLKSILRDKLPR